MAHPKPKRNTVTATFDQEVFDEIEDCVERYGKGDRDRVVVKIVKRYLPLYRAAEEAAFQVLLEQQSSVMGKAAASASANNTPRERRTRKTA